MEISLVNEVLHIFHNKLQNAERGNLHKKGKFVSFCCFLNCQKVCLYPSRSAHYAGRRKNQV